MKLLTKRGYDLGEVVSAMQKAIRRGDCRLGGYWALEMWASGYGEYAWRRLLTVSAEDCWGILTTEIKALHDSYELVNRGKPVREHRGRIFISKAVILMCHAKKSRDADHLQNFVYDQLAGLDAQQLADDLLAAGREEIPAYAYDCHTPKAGGRARPRPTSSVRNSALSGPSSPAFSTTSSNGARPSCPKIRSNPSCNSGA